MKKLAENNKALGTVYAGAVMAIVVNFWPDMFNQDAVIGLQTLIGAVIVWGLTNR